MNYDEAINDGESVKAATERLCQFVDSATEQTELHHAIRVILVDHAAVMGMWTRRNDRSLDFINAIAAWEAMKGEMICPSCAAEFPVTCPRCLVLDGWLKRRPPAERLPVPTCNSCLLLADKLYRTQTGELVCSACAATGKHVVLEPAEFPPIEHCQICNRPATHIQHTTPERYLCEECAKP